MLTAKERPDLYLKRSFTFNQQAKYFQITRQKRIGNSQQPAQGNITEKIMNSLFVGISIKQSIGYQIINLCITETSLIVEDVLKVLNIQQLYKKVNLNHPPTKFNPAPAATYRKQLLTEL